MGTTGRGQAVGLFDAAVVPGARVYSDGRPSNALEDRVLEACALYAAGRCRGLILSGGPGDGPTHEVEAMRRLAESQGVPPDAIVGDFNGINTAATARNAAEVCRQRGWTRVVGVTHFYHAPLGGHGVEAGGALRGHAARVDAWPRIEPPAVLHDA
jgi:vancomycin permeability regulator SanA